ncbi:hypothetical protein DM02DRAFT_180496 [Periconia macrospinosa]|uniref:Uncharacterized protein n=1 Tax=Periconia macrospinosa TaxID=97972 RepID=A0A2V1DCD9_9PLEO|nr:hypothetical protein DM02DRAFT_180496 [Periconia macrospinosa]
MAPRNKVEGRIYSFRSRAECADLGIAYPDLPKLVTCHMVFVLNWVPKRPGYVKVMTITSKARPVGECIPIAPTRKRPYPIQIHLQNGPEENHPNGRIIYPTTLPKFSYLRIDSSYEIPLSVLKEANDYFGDQLMQRPKKTGGLGELRSYLRSMERSQQKQGAITEELISAFGRQLLEDVVSQVP